ncbi:MAG: cytochrome c [Ectothiorhodospiraceae bacterium]|nr:cytochrome c [Chromatiales bacterium]MCP5153823.1 cytochrome c [Ectothiorhodospiraceae bacterium]
MKLRKLALAAFVGSMIALPGIAGADDEGTIKYRQSVMKAVGGHVGAIGSIAKGEGGSADHMKAHTAALADLATMVEAAFKDKVVNEEKSRSLGKIWEDWDGFAKAAGAMKEATAALAAAAAKGEDVGTALKATFDSCKGCHKDFRAEKKG